MANSHWTIKKAREFQRNICYCFIDYVKAFVQITINCGKLLKRWEYQTTLPASWEICMQVRKQQLELNMEQQIGSKSGMEYIKAVYYHPAYLNLYAEYIMQNAGLDEAQAGTRLPGEISITSDM